MHWEQKLEQVNLLLATAAGVATLLLMTRMLGGKDGMQRLQMRAFLCVGNSARNVAAWSDKAYIRVTNVSV